MVLRPVLDAFLDAYPTVSARLLLLDRSVAGEQESGGNRGSRAHPGGQSAEEVAPLHAGSRKPASSRNTKNDWT